MSKIIINMIPEHTTYCEAFAGALWVFFKKEPSRYEVINDRDGELINFYRVLQNHLEEFLKQFKWLLSSHQIWDEWTRQLEAGGLTDIQKAARYYYIQRHSFGGKVRGRTWGAATDHLPRINLLRIEEDLSEIHLRLSRVTIENMDWMVFVKRYDKPTTFFYFDPPYFQAPVYNHNFYKLEDFIAMADFVHRIGGKFILSINAAPEMRKCFAGFKVQRVSVDYTAAGGHRRMVGKELIVKNF